MPCRSPDSFGAVLFSERGTVARANRHFANAVRADGRIDVVPCGEPSPQVEGLLGRLPMRREEVPADAVPGITLWHRPHPVAPHVRPGRNIFWSSRGAAAISSTRRGSYASGAHVVPLGFDPAIYHPELRRWRSSPPASVCSSSSATREKARTSIASSPHIAQRSLQTKTSRCSSKTTRACTSTAATMKERSLRSRG